jgi:hypothetical protein
MNLSPTNEDAQQIVGRERREREGMADFQLPIVDLIRAAASTPALGARRYRQKLAKHRGLYEM